MKYTAVAGLLLFTMGAGCHAWYSRYQGASSRQFDAVVLSLTTRAGFCASPDRACSDVTERPSYPSWTIHGLWPYFLNGDDGPVNCSIHSFRIEDLDEDLLNDLHLDWPSYTDKSEESLWSDEFTKYGTCFMKEQLFVAKPNDYFELATDLYGRYRVGEWLRRSGIRPNSQKPVSPFLIRRAIESYFDGDFALYCEAEQDGIEILQEIRICLDTALFARDCELQSDSCRDQFVWYLQ